MISWVGRDNNKPIGRKATGGGLAAPAFAYYYKKLIELYPDTKRSFDIPEGVFKGEYEGKSELYTANSPLPKLKKPESEFDRMFGGGDDENMEDINPEDAIDMEEDISPEEDIGLAETINIDDDPNEIIESQEEDSDPLHPKRKVPKTPVSEDSGTLF